MFRCIVPHVADDMNLQCGSPNTVPKSVASGSENKTDILRGLKMDTREGVINIPPSKLQSLFSNNFVIFLFV